MKTMMLFLFCLLSLSCLAQETYSIGVANAGGMFFKMSGTIEVADSTVVLTLPGQPPLTKKLLNRPDHFTIYITDGTAIDKITVTPFVGKIKGFSYDHSVVYDTDQKFGGRQIIYFCRRK